jgi:aspartate/methionine/tyrosine aminotransferase
MHWVKTRRSARYNLATSGVASFALRELPFHSRELEINGPNVYGYRPLTHAIGRRYGVDPDSVVEAAGTSMANHLAMAVLIEPGDEVLIEHPAYPLLIDTALYLGARITRFCRFEENGYLLDPAAVRKAVSPATRLIVITNLHNPSSAIAGEDELREVGDIARSIRAHVLVDEVYLDAVGLRTSAHLGKEFVVTSSLTKVYGLSGLRCGWILAEPGLAWRMRNLDNLFGVAPAHPAELLSVAAFNHLEAIRSRGVQLVEEDRAMLHRFLDRQPGVCGRKAEFGTTMLLRLVQGDVEEFAERLRSEQDTAIVPGRFFEMPQHFRVGLGGSDPGSFAEGLRRMESVLP